MLSNQRKVSSVWIPVHSGRRTYVFGHEMLLTSTAWNCYPIGRWATGIAKLQLFLTTRFQIIVCPCYGQKGKGGDLCFDGCEGGVPGSHGYRAATSRIRICAGCGTDWTWAFALS